MKLAFNAVHDTQETYRKLLDSMARPGKIAELKAVEERFVSCYDATFLIAMTLFDAEVNFHVVGDPRLAQSLAEITFAKATTVEKADYIIVPEHVAETEIRQAMTNCRIGTLADPQHAATWMIEQKQLSKKSEWELTGPGIQSVQPFQTGLSDLFWERRAEKVQEFPLGIDLIFTGANGHLACVPRTTNVNKKGATV